MKKIKLRIDFSPIYPTTVKNTLHKDVMSIRVNGGGGMGGSCETIRCTLLDVKSGELGFMKVQEIISGEVVTINPRYIGTIRNINMTELYFEHRNPHFPSGKRTEWLTHPTDTELTFVATNDDLSTLKDYSIIDRIITNDHKND